MRTILVNLFGAPGAGKSVTAAELFACLKKDKIVTELVREHVKEFVWSGGAPGVWDELWFFGEQVRREVTLYGNVQVLITDKPLLMHSFYSGVAGLTKTARGLLTCVDAHEDEMNRHGHVVMNVFCELPECEEEFEKIGRLHDYAEALILDEKLYNFVRGAGRHFDMVGNFRNLGAMTRLIDLIKERMAE